ncbi:inositol polyphosphate multikinase beta-like protein [Carex littledalei]|uniref:Inositol polyphosphate multikinase n=1 Tax=Carex littledalei TaxID=544730 RepID=A0A833QH12_9POAL|nr:inositol polyphosphate multikinase beta-like protein [Carex littledalei]
MLKPPEHQVAGHEAGAGKVGPLVDGSGHFYKPLQPGDERGAQEVAFYTSFSSDPRVPSSIRSFFPSFGGTQLLRTSDSSDVLLPHVVLEDLLHGYSGPSVMDVKIGARTWYPRASESYFSKCLKKDRESTTVPLGFRISGLQVHQESGRWKPDRNKVRKYTVTDVRQVLRQFVSKNPDETHPDCALASSVYGGSNGILAQLLELKSWFEDQTLFHFYSTSVLISYDKGGMGARVKLVDFAHAMEGEGIIDHNFLGGLCSLIKFVSEILTDTEAEVGPANNGIV